MSTKEYGCFFCNGKSTDFSGICNKCGRLIDITEELKKLKIDVYQVKDVIGRGFNGWTLKVEDNYQPFSIKVIPFYRLKEGPLKNSEARALAECSPHRNIARFFRSIEEEISLLNVNIKVNCLVFEYIDNAKPLSKFIADNDVKLTRGDVTSILVGISSGLARLHSKGRWHDDLHDGNILIRDVQPDENLQERFEAKLIDFGSTKPLILGEPESVERSDYSYLGKHVYTLTAKFEYSNQGLLTPVDRNFASRLRHLGHRLSDKDVSRRNLQPSDLPKIIRDILDESSTGYNFPSFNEMIVQSRISLKDPLENTNAISLKPQDIALLFVDALGWTSRLEKSEPVFIIGPRGCGKTMLLRYLSISSQARPLKNEDTKQQVAHRLNKGNYIAFLINGSELRTPFLRSSYRKLEETDANVAEDFCREWLNAQFAFEVVRTITWLQSENLIDINEDDLAPIYAVFENLFLGKKKRTISNNLESLTEAIEKRVMILSNLPEPKAYQPTNLCRDDALLRLALALKAFSWMKSKEVWFLLDDYSVTVLPPLAIRAYNPVLFRLSSEVKIKISSEGEGPTLEDNLKRKYKEGRELTKVNLGEVYFQAKEITCQRFFEKILEARFKETGKGSLDQLRKMLKEHPQEKGFGKYILQGHERPGDAQFHGFGLICRLCSGDISYILELLHLLTIGRWDRKAVPLSPNDQDEIIKRFAHRQLADLRSTAQFGPKLHEFALRLGNLLKQYLLDSKKKQNPDERLRIEIEGPGELRTEAQLMQEELLRHSILIAGGSGKSKEGLPTRKLFFRRLFASCFPFSPSRKGCIALKIKDYEAWLLDPKEIPSKPIRQETIRYGEN